MSKRSDEAGKQTLNINNWNHAGSLMLIGTVMPILLFGFLAWGWTSGEFAKPPKPDDLPPWLLALSITIFGIVAVVLPLVMMKEAVLSVEFADKIVTIRRILGRKSFQLSELQRISFKNVQSQVDSTIPGLGVKLGIHRIMCIRCVQGTTFEVMVSSDEEEQAIRLLRLWDASLVD
jgi:hypothetical protein